MLEGICDGDGIKVGALNSRRINTGKTMKKIVVRTGGKTPVSGIYRPTGGRYESTLDEGERVPPNNQGTRQTWNLVRKAKHKS